MIAILDYGVGNLGSIANMIKRCNGDAAIVSSSDQIAVASGIVLPGVGAFDIGMSKLKASGLLPTLEHTVFTKKIPVLGICLGMQLLFESSEEGREQGLGWIPGNVKRFDFRGCDSARLKVPHMGWNEIRAKADRPLFKHFETAPRFYFVHSYYAVCNDEADIAATCRYGFDFTCAVQKGNVFGVQFHPEKSHKFGMQLFANFLELTC